MAGVTAINANAFVNSVQSMFSNASSGQQSSASSTVSPASDSVYRLNLSAMASNLVQGIVSSNLNVSPLEALAQSLTYLNMTSQSNVNPSLAYSFVNPSSVSGINQNSLAFSNTLGTLSGSLSNANSVQQSELLNTNPSAANAIANPISSQNILSQSNQTFQSFLNTVHGLSSNQNPLVNFTA